MPTSWVVCPCMLIFCRWCNRFRPPFRHDWREANSMRFKRMQTKEGQDSVDQYVYGNRNGHGGTLRERTDMISLIDALTTDKWTDRNFLTQNISLMHMIGAVATCTRLEHGKDSRPYLALHACSTSKANAQRSKCTSPTHPRGQSVNGTTEDPMINSPWILGAQSTTLSLLGLS